MKIEDIEKLSMEELEKISEDSSVEIPTGLGERIEDRIMATQIASKGKTVRLQWKSFAAATAIAASLAIFATGINLSTNYRTPSDTFSSPEEAYAQVERTFALISHKVAKGKNIADAAVPHMQKTSYLLHTK